MNKQAYRFLILIILYIITLMSCFNPIDPLMILKVTDTIAPEIAVTLPMDQSFYAGTVIVNGTVSDYISEDNQIGEIESLLWSIEPAFLTGGSVDIAEDGSFSFNFSTSGFSGTFLLSLSAVDGNRNEILKTITLNKADSAIPSLSAAADNSQITLTWDDVPLATDYTLYYTTDGSQPSEYYGESVSGVSSPYVFDNLKNGSKHVFQLRAAKSGDDDFSSYVNAIPLSKMTLMSKLDEGPGMVRVYWPSIPGTEYYTVLRATSFTGTYINISGSFSGTVFEDRSVEEGLIYWYKIRPESSEDVISYAASIGVSPFVRSFEKHRLNLSDPGTGMAVSGDYAYISDTTYGIRIIDISDPGNPHIVGSGASGNSGDPNNIAISGDYAYISDYNKQGILIYNISTPSSPEYVKTLSITGNPRDVVTSGSYAYAASTDGVQVIDISVPAAASVVNSVSTGAVYSLEIDGINLYFGMVGEVERLDITNPEGVLSSVTIYSTGGSYGIANIVVKGNYAYLDKNNEGFEIIELSGNTSVFSDGVIASRNVLLIDDFAAVPHFDGIKFYNIQSPAAAYAVKDITTSGIGSVAVQDGIHTVLLTSDSLFTINTSIFQPVDSQYDSGLAYGLAGFHNGYVYAYDGMEKNVFMHNETDPPFGAAASDTTNGQDVLSLVVAGDYFFTGNYNKIFVADQSDLTSPSYIGNIGSNGDVYSLEGNGEYLYSILSGGDGVSVIDISDPASAAVDLDFSTSYSPGDIALRGDYAYLSKGMASPDCAVNIYSISNPLAPVQKHALTLTGKDVGQTIKLNGNYAILTEYNKNSIELLDIENPESLISYTITPDGTINYNSALMIGDLLLIGTSTGVEIIDVSDPANSKTVRTISTGESVYSLELRGNYIYANKNVIQF